MTRLNIPLDIAPYFDDYEDEKNFHRILFKPAVAVQARELTQLQTILQEQVARFGDNILQTGTIVEGGNFVEERRLPYIKVRDAAFDAEGNVVSSGVTAYIGMRATGLTTGLQGLVVAAEQGLESQTPDLSTIYVRYTNNAQDGGDNNVTLFSSTEEIQIAFFDDDLQDYVDYHRLSGAGAIEVNSTGYGYGVRCGDGIIYQKGFFTRFVDAVTIVSRYDNNPDDVVVGFQTIESIVTSNADQSLLDNAAGYPNLNAPGADRLKLEPILVSRTIAEAEEDEDFFAIQEYDNGRVVRRNLTTQFDSINDVLEQRTSEESGNYTKSDFKIRVKQSTSNTENLSVIIGTGVSYVEGRRVELINDYSIDTPEANTFESAQQQDVIANYGNYIRVDSLEGNFDTDSFPKLQLRNVGATQIGSARGRAVVRETGSTNFRIYLSAINMFSGGNFADVTTIRNNPTGATAEAILEGGKAVIKDAAFNVGIFPIGQDFVRSVDPANSDYIYRIGTTAVVPSGGIFNVTLIGDDVFPYTVSAALNSDQRDELIVTTTESVGGYADKEVAPITAATLDSTGKILTVTIADPTANMNVIVEHDIKKTTVAINQKTLETVYVKIDCSANDGGITGNYNLGIPDGFKLLNVYRHTSYSEDSAYDVTRNFKITDGQYDSYYGFSKLRMKKNLTLTTADRIVVKLEVLHNDNGLNSFFTADSYPVDDVTATLPVDKIRTESIPKYRSGRGVTYYLRDAIDTRPVATATAAYSTTLGGATIDPDAALIFANTIIPSPNKSIEIEFSYYLGRKDLVVIDGFGDFQVINGTPSEAPKLPAEPTKGMVLATLDIPPFPSLPTKLANRAGKSDYGISIARRTNRGYTMKDIGGIEKRIDNLEYYTVLNALETSAIDMAITDVNGLDRFKNGIFVDTFDNLIIADVNDTEFSAGIDPSESEIHPKFRTYPIGLKIADTTNTVEHNEEVISLTKDDVVIMNQPYATKGRSCTTNFYKYNGTIQMSPEYDVAPDYTRAPDVNFEIDLTSAFVEYTEALSEFVPLSTAASSTVASAVRSGNSITTTSTITSTSSELVVDGANSFTDSVGDFVTDVNFSPYMRTKRIKLAINGLRPNTRFYFFFDGTNVDTHVARARVVNGRVKRSTKFGTHSVKSDSDGNLYAVFRLPEETFFVGDRYLEVSDLSDYANIGDASSSARKRYSAFNFSVEKTGVDVTTRAPEFVVDESVSISSSSTTSFVNVWSDQRGNQSPDPIAQTFIIDSNQSNDTSVMLSKIDLYFYSKSRDNKGVTIQIREVSNGYPTSVVVPFSSTHLTAVEVTANRNTASTPTTVTFEAPVSIRKEREYCVVVKPDGNDPEYRLWVSQVGGTDVDRNIAVTQDSNAGTLFTSTNDKAWTAYQDENVKFRLHACDFDVAAGSVVMETNDFEFFDIENITADFENDEIVYAEKVAYHAGTVTVAEFDENISGVGTLFTVDYNEGDYIVMLADNGEREVMRILSITNDTAMISHDAAKREVTGETEHYSTPAGRVTYYTDVEPPVMLLEESSARFGMVFANGDTIVGENTEARADIALVDDLPVSWFQANIARSNFSRTRTGITANKLWQGDTSYYNKNIDFKANNYLDKRETWIRSKSNDANTSSFELTIDMESLGSKRRTSPMVDYTISNITAYQYMVNDDATDEIGTLGETTSKYISRRVELSDGLDAEDMKLYLTAFKPAGTDIDVYVRFQSATDDRDIADVEWTLLDPKTATYGNSSPNNRKDYKEIEFNLGDTVLGAGEGAYRVGNGFQYTSADGAIHTNYKYFTIKIGMRSNGFHRVPRIKDLRAIALT